MTELPKFEEKNEKFNPFGEIESDLDVSEVISYITWIDKVQDEKRSMYEKAVQPFEDNIQKAKDWLDSELESLENTKKTLTINMKVYLMRVNQEREAKGLKPRKSIKSPLGTFQLRAVQPEFKKEDALLLEYAKERGLTTKKETISVNWAEIKKSSQVVGDKLVDENGEIVAGVQVVLQDDKASVKLT